LFRGKIFVLFCWLGLVFVTPVFTIFVQFLSFTKKTGIGITLYMSLQYRNKFKSQLTSPTPAQLPAVAVSSGHIVYVNEDLGYFSYESLLKK
jgi:hypothetical protein